MKKEDLEKINIRKLRNRLFVRKTAELHEHINYRDKYDDDVPEQIEKLHYFDGWGNFAETWDILWVGLDPRNLIWIEGRHHSPAREIIYPIRIVRKDLRSGRLILTPEDKKAVLELKVPFKKPLPETEEDRMISDSLTERKVNKFEEHQDNVTNLEAQLKEMMMALKQLKDNTPPVDDDNA